MKQIINKYPITSAMSCPICTETFNISTRKKLSCQSCDHVCCMTCSKTYLLQSVNQPHCMSCRAVWSVEWLNASFPSSFLKKEYRTMRETILLEEEKTHLPAYQAEAERRIKVDDNDSLIDIQLRLKHTNQINEQQMVFEQRQTDRTICCEIARLEHIRLNLSKRKSVSERHEFIMRCPLGECRGFLSAQYICGICTTQICKECHHTKLEPHVCDPNEVATVIELRQHTKPCPKCRAPIFKIDGCDQMFCTRDQCHTAFSWRTGLVEEGIIHNPHYFAALRQGNIRDPRHRQDPECGMPRYNHIYDLVFGNLGRLDLFEFERFYQQTVHHRTVTLVRLTERPDRIEDRVAYLTGKMDEKKFKQRLFVTDQRNMRYIEERQIMDSFVIVCEELFREYVRVYGTNPKDTLDKLRHVFNITCDAYLVLDKKYQHKGIVSIVQTETERFIRDRF